MALENAEVSPVLSLVAVTVTQVPTARPLDRLKLIVASAAGAGRDRRRAEERLALAQSPTDRRPGC